MLSQHNFWLLRNFGAIDHELAAVETADAQRQSRCFSATS
jgi:hypothetical protein